MARHSEPIRTSVAAALLAVLLLLACQPARPDATSDDDAARAADSPRRIVSLVPAVTELLFAFGAEGRLQGRTRWGMHPPEARSIPDVGDGMRPSLEAVVEREPDLVILYEGVANEGVAGRLEGLGIPTLTVRHDRIEDLMRNARLLGDVLGCPARARRLTAGLEEGLARVREATRGLPSPRVYIDTWADPPITIGRGSFLDSLVAIAGGRNLFGDRPEPSPRVSVESIVHRDPDVVLTTAHPDSLGAPPALADRPGWAQIPAVAEGRIAAVDRDLVTRLGPRIVEAAWAIAGALHPALEAPASPAPIPPSEEVPCAA